jgi:AraC-like DNA-binding protein
MKHVDKDLEFLVKVTELYEKNLEKQRMSIDELASEMCMSRSQFTRRMVAATGSVPSTYFNRLRMEKAQRLLKDTEKPIGTIAYECGFDDTPYFCNLFKKLYKVTPMQYRIMPKTD